MAIMACDAGRAAYTATRDIATRIGNMTQAELLALDEILDYPELLKYWNYLTGEDIDAIIAFMKENAEQDF